MTRYRTIVADPPWDVQRLESPGAEAFGTQDHTLRSVRLSYPTMSVEEISALPVGSMADENAHLYVWTINRYIESTYDIARTWGFRPTALLTWAKSPMGLGPGGAFSQTTEHILFCRRGSDVRVSRADSTWWNWKRGAHSAKPDAFLDIVEQVSPGPYLEIFARRARFGWDYAGDGSLGTVSIPGLREPGTNVGGGEPSSLADATPETPGVALDGPPPPASSQDDERNAA